MVAVTFPETVVPSRKVAGRQLRLVAVALTMVVAMMGYETAPAGAISLTWKWYGVSAGLNRSETNKLAFASGGAAAIATLIPDPTLSKVAAARLGVYSAYAGYVYSTGRCVYFEITWWDRLSGGAYSGGPCR